MGEERREREGGGGGGGGREGEEGGGGEGGGGKGWKGGGGGREGGMEREDIMCHVTSSHDNSWRLWDLQTQVEILHQVRMLHLGLC